MLNFTLDDIKKGANITGNYQDEAIQFWIDETVAYLVDAGVKPANITAGIVARGVADLWDYGSGTGKLSSYFMNRATQLSYKG